MFETKSISLPQLIETAYYAMLALERRFDPEDLEERPILRGSASEPGPESRKLAQEWIEEIRQHERRSIHDLDNTTLQRYVGELSAMVLQRMESEVKPDAQRARRLLEKLDREVSIRPAA